LLEGISFPSTIGSALGGLAELLAESLLERDPELERGNQDYRTQEDYE